MEMQAYYHYYVVRVCIIVRIAIADAMALVGRVIANRIVDQCWMDGAMERRLLPLGTKLMIKWCSGYHSIPEHLMVVMLTCHVGYPITYLCGDIDNAGLLVRAKVIICCQI
ncbi:hypothetical protein GUJ93_ZPchr0006g43944 [Zizania palustris]|uniref:Uncharacterized protein n=1 Tax=Zizania palustris TaxID=103762 RepID=A0A8J5SIM3_ZIZPA|nr:hypothetical protein GUJ93_ZPchr0006g43944 [Zizania palustris]